VDWNFTRQAELATALREVIPSHLQDSAEPLAALVGQALARKAESAENEIDSTADPLVGSALRSLAGQKVQVGPTSAIHFGSGNRFRDLTVHGDVAGRDVVKVHVNIAARDSAPSSALEAQANRRNQLLLLRKVEMFWIDTVLARAEESSPALDLKWVPAPNAVAAPWHVNVDDERQFGNPRWQQAPIGDLFATERSLLILGAAGSGKTILLLQLTRALIARARQDEVEPIPVVFNLSSFAAPSRLFYFRAAQDRRGLRSPLEAWLEAELNAKYQVPRRIGRQWLASDAIILLLDGLDEVPPEYRTDCVSSLNQFRLERGFCDVAVTCRTDAYEVVPERLLLTSAVRIRPLSVEQIDSYLAQSGPRLAAIRMQVRRDRWLGQFASSPLVLNLLRVVYQSPSRVQADGLASEGDPYRELLRAYVSLSFQHRSQSAAAYSAPLTVNWLQFLARQMNAHAQSIFLPEQLQPGWLPNRRQLQAYILLSRSAAGFLIGAAIAPTFGATGLLLGTLAGVASAAATAVQQRFDVPSLTGGRTGPRLLIATAHVLGIVGCLSIAGWLVGNAALGAVVGAICGIALGTRAAYTTPSTDITLVDRLGWSTRSALKGLAVGFIVALLGTIFLVAADYALERNLDWTSIAMGGLEAVLEDVFSDPTFGLLTMLLPLFGALFGGLTSGLRTSTIERSHRPNQGMFTSAKSALKVGTLMYVVCGGPLAAAYALSELSLQAHPPTEVLAAAFIGWIKLGLIFAAPAATWYGGQAVVRHACLRMLFGWCGTFAFRVVKFMSFAEQRMLVKSAGGGYVFLHKSVQDYFASLGESAKL
jgi:eukaryotic-like serine/threonine-protein kinase